MLPVGSVYLPCMFYGLFLWIWATLYREDRGWGFQNIKQEDSSLEKQIEELSRRFDELEKSIAQRSDNGSTAQAGDK